MLNKSLIGVFFITFIYLLAIFLKQPLEYVFNIPLLPLSLLSLILINQQQDSSLEPIMVQLNSSWLEIVQIFYPLTEQILI